MASVIARISASVLLIVSLSGCVVLSIADAAISLATGVVKTTVNVASAAVDAVIPDDEDEEDE